jgi:cysteine desulfurase
MFATRYTIESMFWKRSKRIYLDYASLAPRDEKLFRELVKDSVVGNPSSFHREGVDAKRALDTARAIVAKAICSLTDEIIFTSGGTEGDNIAILGVLEAYTGTAVPHMIVSAVEHSAVLETVKYLESRGKISLSYIPVDEHGVVDTKEFRALLRPETILVSVMHVNNEVGTIEPVAEVAKAIRHYKKMTKSQAPPVIRLLQLKLRIVGIWILMLGVYMKQSIRFAAR